MGAAPCGAGGRRGLGRGGRFGTLDDMAALCLRLEQLPALADECASDKEIEALCDLEEALLSRIAGISPASLREIALQAEVLVRRLTAEGSDAQLSPGEADLLQAIARNLRAWC